LSRYKTTIRDACYQCHRARFTATATVKLFF